MAAAVMTHRAGEAGLAGLVIDSAGTGGWHVGEPADPRTAAELHRRGVELRHTARQFARSDFDRFDLVLAMDGANASALRRLAPTPADAAKVRLLREFDPRSDGDLDVPDPYYGGPEGFSAVFDMVDAACMGLLETLRGS